MSSVLSRPCWAIRGVIWNPDEIWELILLCRCHWYSSCVRSSTVLNDVVSRRLWTMCFVLPITGTVYYTDISGRQQYALVRCLSHHSYRHLSSLKTNGRIRATANTRSFLRPAPRCVPSCQVWRSWSVAYQLPKSWLVTVNRWNAEINAGIELGLTEEHWHGISSTYQRSFSYQITLLERCNAPYTR